MKRWLALAMCAAAGVAIGAERVQLPGEGLTLQALIYRPAGPGPFPAIVLLHGCSGMWASNGAPNRTYEHWANRLRAEGFVALMVDSFGSRGAKEICTQARRGIRPTVERVADAHAARRWLETRADVRANDVHVLGWSNGAMTALHALRAATIPAAAGFRSAVAFYPGCRNLLKGEYRPASPLLVQAGAADDWTPARHCETLVERVRVAGGAAEIDVYPGAHHAFDRIGGRVRYRADVRNPASPTGWGAHVGPEPKARTLSLKRAIAFLKAHSPTFHVEQETASVQMP